MSSSAEPKPYKISVPQSKLDRLAKKLELVELPDETPGLTDSWSRGTPLKSVSDLVTYWRDTFSWRDAEAKLNDLPQFTLPVTIPSFGTHDLHFVHSRSSNPSAIPLLFIHGWPGSFIEVAKILEPLTKPTSPDQPSFHVVAPSLINFGFSSGCPQQGFTLDQHAQSVHQLMLSLGYDKYVTQGGDIGYFVSRFLAQMYPEQCLATHLNLVVPSEPTLTSNPVLFAKSQTTPLSDFEKRGLARSKWFREEGSGYMKEQGTKPQTLGYSLTDSPVGLLAWIYEKLHDWSDLYPWTPDEILTWVSIYYFSTAGPAASLRIYYEMEHRKPHSGGEEAMRSTSTSPTLGGSGDGPLIGIARFPKEIVQLPKVWHEGLGKVVRWREFEHGGHFPSWERPEDLVADVRGMFGRGGEAQGIVPGRSGY